MKRQLFTMCIVGLCTYSLSSVDGKELPKNKISTENNGFRDKSGDVRIKFDKILSKTTGIKNTVQLTPIQVAKRTPKPVKFSDFSHPVPLPYIVHKQVPFEIKVIKFKPFNVHVEKPVSNEVVKSVTPSVPLHKNYTVQESVEIYSTEKQSLYQANVYDNRTNSVKVEKPKPALTYPTETTTYSVEPFTNYVLLEDNREETAAAPSDDQEQGEYSRFE